MPTIRAERLTVQVDGPFVIFLIGMRFNRPWKIGSWLPVFLAMPRMLAELSADADSGFLGATQWVAPPNVMVVQYWRSFELLEHYARSRDQTHWPAWVAFNKKVGSNGDVGIWHETYGVQEGAYEAIYNNMPPFGLGRVGTLMSATGKRMTAAQRIGAREGEEPQA
jgi:hypothetical protein